MAAPDRWQKVEEIFHEALDRPERERESWLDLSCGGDAELRRDVASLLASDRAAAGAFVGSKVERAVVELDSEIEPKVVGRRLGPYRLIRELGRGGMGTVYLAERAGEQYQTEVAIKLIRPGMDTRFLLSRFRPERQTLARLQHPNIARLLDSGTTGDGLPYIVMERIVGRPINAYCREAALSVNQKLRLFLSVCSAVAHAHQNFVIHRDLKPGNIRVDSAGAPKLLDFGICKLLFSEGARDATITQGTSMLTPDYASPEQVRADQVTVASDIYSLGAVLYELLTGVRPHRIVKYTPQAGNARSARKKSGVQAWLRPSGLWLGAWPSIWIIFCSRRCNKEPQRRYASVEQFADDVQRSLDDRPCPRASIRCDIVRRNSPGATVAEKTNAKTNRRANASGCRRCSSRGRRRFQPRRPFRPSRVSIGC